MAVKLRKYSGDEDQRAMIALARSQSADTLHVTDLPYRLSSWALDQPANVALWQDDHGRLVAWAVLQTPFWTVDYVYSPVPEPDLHHEILSWADQQARESIHSEYGHPSWYVNVFANQAKRRRDLEQAGFTDQAEAGEAAWSKVWLALDGDVKVPQYPLPAGFTMRPLAGKSEVEAYVALHQAVFQTRNMTSAWRRRTLQQPEYNPQVDIVVVALDGRLAAFCIGWLSASPGGEVVAQIEPLGCHADFRRYALGRVALCETLHRLQQLGAGNIYVETDNYRNTAFRLYESVGFHVVRQVRVYGKDYNDSAF